MGNVDIDCMTDSLHADSPPLSPEEMDDVNNFYDNPADQKVGTLEELLEDLHDVRCGD